jgi:hypothetical protein
MSSEHVSVLDPSPESVCAQFQPALSAYLDGELDLGQSGVLIRHLEVCEECAGKLEMYRELGERLRRLPAAAVPADLGLRLRVRASHFSVRGGWAQYWRLRLMHAIQAMAVPAAVGTATALFLFSALAGGVQAKVSVRPGVPDVQVGMGAMPPRLTRSSDFDIAGPMLVEAQIDASGHVYGYSVLSGNPDAQAITRLKNQLLMSVFQPATTIFGQPTNGSLLVSFGTVDVRG